MEGSLVVEIKLQKKDVWKVSKNKRERLRVVYMRAKKR